MRWIERRGWRVARLHEDVPPARSGLREAIGRVQSRETDGMVAARLTQLGGTLHDALATVERIQAAGGIFVSVHDRLDLSTPAGRRRHRHLLAMPASGAEVGAVPRSRLPQRQAAVRERP
jgi:DNA invertase Pin-like site-specific DNA recombinase